MHIALGPDLAARRRRLFRLIHSREVTLAGYSRKRIYGLLTCRAGRRMKTENRVFFSDEAEALRLGYRPCGACLPEKYRQWKKGSLPAEELRTDTND